MTSTNPLLDNFVDNDWQLLGWLTLPTDRDIDSTIGAWVSATLRPLQLQTDFTGKVVYSAQQAVKSARLADKIGKFEQFHLLVFSQKESKDHTSTWGFFRIEKIEHTLTEKELPDHSIELYLYREG